MKIVNWYSRHFASRPAITRGVVAICFALAALSGSVARAEISLSFGGGFVPAGGDTRMFGVRIARNTESLAIHAIDVTLEYDADVIAIADVIASSGTSGWGNPAWSAGSGILRVAHVGPASVTGSVLFDVVVRAAVNPVSQSTSIGFGRIELNDGIAAEGTGATITLDGTPIVVDGVTVAPTSATVREGESLVLTALVDTNGDPAVDWSFGDGFEIGQLFPSGLYVAPSVLARSREIVVRATSRLHPDFYAEAAITLLPVVGSAQPELWVTTNPANPRILDIYAGTGANPDATVTILVGGVALPVTAMGVPVSAYHAIWRADPSAASVAITVEIDATSITRTITF